MKKENEKWKRVSKFLLEVLIFAVLLLPAFLLLNTTGSIFAVIYFFLGMAIGMKRGYCSKTLQLEEKFFNALVENYGELLNGKTIRIIVNNDDEVQVNVVETKQKKPKKESETKQ